ncbi:unnamed protein product [Pleuronectes platessa]|uniref:Uncharacterized protein n=1 Tax=Pleuronectes platessa TaxID=8262 RepID=A0A9N7TIA4_PLEPL|nr:unnamed protein product [Pleuronectes platessa]
MEPLPQLKKRVSKELSEDHPIQKVTHPSLLPPPPHPPPPPPPPSGLPEGESIAKRTETPRGQPVQGDDVRRSTIRFNTLVLSSSTGEQLCLQQFESGTNVAQDAFNPPHPPTSSHSGISQDLDVAAYQGPNKQRRLGPSQRTGVIVQQEEEDGEEEEEEEEEGSAWYKVKVGSAYGATLTETPQL